MRITQLTYLQTKNLGNYEKAELSAIAVLEDGEDVNTVMLSLKNFVQASLNGEIEKIEVKETPAPVVEEVKEETKKEKKEKKSKKKKEEEVIEPETSKEEEEEEVKEDPKKTKNVKYDSSVKEVKSVLGSYLNKKYGASWSTLKPKEEIIAFTSSLNGKDFMDEKGNILESFLNEVHGFFNVED